MLKELRTVALSTSLGQCLEFNVTPKLPEPGELPRSHPDPLADAKKPVCPQRWATSAVSRMTRLRPNPAQSRVWQSSHISERHEGNNPLKFGLAMFEECSASLDKLVANQGICASLPLRLDLRTEAPSDRVA